MEMTELNNNFNQNTQTNIISLSLFQNFIKLNELYNITFTDR